MNIIQNNPYRIIGILSNATLRDIEKQKGKIKAYARVGREIKSDYDFTFFENLSRTEDSINQACSKIEQNQDRLTYSLFWFLNANSFDDTAIEYLKNGNEEKAIEIWQKVTSNKEVNSKNFSAFNNLGTLHLSRQSATGHQEGIEAKIKLIKSDCFETFVHIVADETYTIDKERQIQQLINELLVQFQNQYSSIETLQLFANCTVSTQKYITQKFKEKPIHQIESQIESTKTRRKENKREAYQFGRYLYKSCLEDLSLLRSLAGTDGLQYMAVADNLAKEIMQCGIDYFKECKDESDPSKEALNLLKKAKKIAVGSQTLERIKDNIEGIKEWAENEPIKEDLDFIVKKLKSYQEEASNYISNAKTLVSSCRIKLQNIRMILGSNDKFYLDICSTVVNNALGMIIDVVNEAQSGIEYDKAKLLRLPNVVKEAISAIAEIGSLDMNSETRKRFVENQATIIGINEQLKSSLNSTSSGGCYIATMAYGNYDHPQVIELRKFRDSSLVKTIIGKIFIKIYYKYSPNLVEKLKNKQNINLIIRKGLDQFIKAIKK